MVSMNRVAFGRVSSSTRIVAKIGADNRPPYAADIPPSVFVARMSSLSFRRCETQVPSPPPILPSASSGPRLAPPANDTSETATAFRTVEGSTRWSFSSWTVPGILTGSRNTRRRTPTSTPAAPVTATHQRLPSNQPGLFGSVNQSLVPPLTYPKNAKLANASTTPNDAAYPISRQNPGDRASATPSGPDCDPSPEPGCDPALTDERSTPGRQVGDGRRAPYPPQRPSGDGAGHRGRCQASSPRAASSPRRNNTGSV